MKPLSENRRARFDFEILDTLEAGMELTGQEVKSAKAGRMQITGSHVIVRGGEAWLVGAEIPPYQPRNITKEYDPARTRRLLVKRDELKSLIGALERKSLAVIPLAVRLKRGFVKLEIGTGKSRKRVDKRELLKSRTVEREMKRHQST